MNKYVLASVFQKSIRWCDVNASRYFAQKYLDKGSLDGLFEKLILVAAEDVGLADPSLIVYERECWDHFKSLIKKHNITTKQAVKFPTLCEIVDRAVIAAALAYKSRLLPQASFATLYDIYQHEDFSKDPLEYIARFLNALKERDEKEALYNAYVAGIFLNSMDQILEMIERLGGTRNGNLIPKWVKEYRRKKKLFLMLAGSIVLLCRDLNYQHGEYVANVSKYLSSPIEEAPVPDRAYDQHTSSGKRKGRGLKHFFEEGATIKKERFENNWDKAGTNAYLDAEKKGLGKADEIIEAIKRNYEKSRKSSKLEEIYN